MAYNPSATLLTEIPGALNMQQISTPGTLPASGYDLLYFKSDGNLYKLNSNAVETMIGGGASGANTALSNLISTAINVSLVPGVSSLSLGSVGTANFWQSAAIQQLFDTITPFNLSVDLHARTLNDSSGSAQLSWFVGGVGIAGHTQFGQIVTPGNPAPGLDLLYFKSDDGLYMLNSTGTESLVASVGGNANRTLSNLTGPLAINEHLLPVSNSNFNLGSAALAWQNLFIGGYESMAQIATPATPAAGIDLLYFKSDDNLYRLNSAGVETQIGAGAGSGANQALSNLTATAINQDLKPSGSHSLGASGAEWANLFLSSALTFSVGGTWYRTTQTYQVSTTDATVTTIADYTPASNNTLAEARVVGDWTGGSAGTAGDGAYFIVRARIKSSGGSVTSIENQIVETSQDQSWVASFGISGGGDLIVTVQGAANNNIDWTCTLILDGVSL